MPYLGYKNALYINTAASGTPTWVEIDLAKDVTVNKEKAEVDGTARTTARLGWEAIYDGLKKFSIEFDSLKPATTETNTAFSTLNSAFIANTPVDVVVCDDDKSGVSVPGIRCSAAGVFGGTESQPLKDMTTVKFSLKAQAAPVAGTFTSGVWTSGAW